MYNFYDKEMTAVCSILYTVWWKTIQTLISSTSRGHKWVVVILIIFLHDITTEGYRQWIERWIWMNNFAGNIMSRPYPVIIYRPTNPSFLQELTWAHSLTRRLRQVCYFSQNLMHKHNEPYVVDTIEEMTTFANTSPRKILLRREDNLSKREQECPASLFDLSNESK